MIIIATVRNENASVNGDDSSYINDNNIPIDPNERIMITVIRIKRIPIINHSCKS